MWNLRLVSIIALISIIMPMFAADPGGDPLESLDSKRAFTYLVGLREPLDRAPDDQRLLSQAITAYVVLSLPTQLVDAGDAGPFLGYARQLRERCVKIRNNAPPADLVTALPELWLDAISGDMKAAVDGLARFADADANPTARGLRCFATRDWRALKARTEVTPLENYALSWARMECSTNYYGSDDRLPRGTWSSRIRAAMRMGMNPDSHNNEGELAKAVLSDVVWMLGSSTISDSEAMDAIARLLTACGQKPNVGKNRSELSAQALTIIRTLTGNGFPKPNSRERVSSIPALVMACHICDELTTRPAGLMDGTHYRLLGLGDVARWNRDWLMPLIHVAFVGAGEQNQSVTSEENEGRASIEALAKDALPAAWATLRWSEEQHDEFEPYHRNATLDDVARRSVLDLLQRESLRAVPHSDGVLMAVGATLAMHGPCADLPIFFDTLQQRRAVTGHPLPGILDRRRWCLAASWGGVEADAAMRARLDEWLLHDPWDMRLRFWKNRWSPDHHYLDLPAPPNVSWIDRQPGTSPLPNATNPSDSKDPLKKWFATRWQGWIRVPKDGEYRFKISSPDGVRLIIGPMVFDKWFYRWLFGSTDRTVSWNLPAGWQPFRMECFAGYDMSQCRLSWMVPGGTTMDPIPADCFAHGDAREPGVEAAIWQNHKTRLGFIPTADDLAWLHDHPWFTKAWDDAAVALVNHDRWDEAAALLKELSVADSGEVSQGALAYALLFQTPPQPTRAFALMTQHQTLEPTGWDESESPRKLVMRAAQLGQMNELMAGTQSMQNREQYSGALHVTRGIGSLITGDFVQAEKDRRWFLDDKNHWGFRWAWEKRQTVLEALVLKRINGKPDGDVDEVLSQLEEFSVENCSWDKVSADYLTGLIDWPTAEKRAATTSRPMQVRFYHALQAFAEHRWDEVRADLIDIGKTEPESDLGTVANALRAWFERQTPAQLDSRPKAMPIPKRADPDQTSPANKF